MVHETGRATTRTLLAFFFYLVYLFIAGLMDPFKVGAGPSLLQRVTLFPDSRRIQKCCSTWACFGEPDFHPRPDTADALKQAQIPKNSPFPES